MILTANTAWYALTHINNQRTGLRTHTVTRVKYLADVSEQHWWASVRWCDHEQGIHFNALWLTMWAGICAVFSRCLCLFWGVICTTAVEPSGAALVKHAYDPLSRTKENWGYERRGEEDNMNIIFWFLEEDIPCRPRYEYLIKLAFPQLFSMFYSVDLGNVTAGSPKQEYIQTSKYWGWHFTPGWGFDDYTGLHTSTNTYTLIYR